MSGKQAFDRKIEQLSALRADPASAATAEQLRKALRDRSNFIVAKAAAIAGELGREELTPDLAAAFERFLEDASKTDPQCWAKNAIVKTLKGLSYDDSTFYLRGLSYYQREPSWNPGGPNYTDTAVMLRGECALALIECCRGLPDLEIMSRLTDLLADPEVGARQDAARALAHLGRPEGALLLKLKIYNGDPAPEVIGQCFGALLSLTGAAGVGLVVKYLEDANEDLRFEAAAALGESRIPQAFDALKSHWEGTRDPRFRRALLLSMGALRLEPAIDHLISLISRDNPRTAADAVAALAPSRYRDEVWLRVEAAVRETGSGALREAMRKVEAG